MTPYKHYPKRPQQLTPGFVQAEFERVLESLPAADKAPAADGWLDATHHWNSLRAYLEGERARLGYAFSKNCLDPALEAQDKYFREQVIPVQEEGDSRYFAALARTPHRPGISAKYGQYFLDRMAAGQPAVDPVNSDLRVQVGELSMQYDKAVASGEVTVGGEKMTLTRAVGIANGADQADQRREAFLAYRGWFVANRAQLAGIYSQMLKLRDQMGRNLGHTNFVPLGYAGMARTDYGPVQAAAFRKGVREHFVPLNRQLIACQAKEMGTPTLKPWDAGFHPSLSIPLGAVPVAGQLDAAQRVFSKMSPQLAKHFTNMRERGLIDLENRKGKAPGGYCTSFNRERRPFIFMNAVGLHDDVQTLLHEAGHS
ncbi:MAG: M3 family metallopeptidase, partial [Ramlibacter sp.]